MSGERMRLACDDRALATQFLLGDSLEILGIIAGNGAYPESLQALRAKQG